MRKIITSILTVTMIMTVCATTAFAAGRGHEGNKGSCVNANNNRVCNTNSVTCSFKDADGDGICDDCGVKMNASKCKNFVDENNDGICDNHAEHICYKANTSAVKSSHGHHGGHHR